MTRVLSGFVGEAIHRARVVRRPEVETPSATDSIVAGFGSSTEGNPGNTSPSRGRSGTWTTGASLPKSWTVNVVGSGFGLIESNVASSFFNASHSARSGLSFGNFLSSWGYSSRICR